MKWFLMAVLGACLCSLAIGQEPLVPIPDTGGTSSADCDALRAQIDALDVGIARTEARITMVELLAQIEIDAIDACLAEYLAAQARGAEPFELIAIHQRSFGHWQKLEEYQKEIKELDAKLANDKFRRVMLVLQYLMECG